MTAPLISRDGELEEVERFLDDNGMGSAALVVEGEAGIGKTVVWKEAVRRAEARDYGVLSSRPAEAEAKLSYTAVADLLSGVDDEVLAFLPGPQRRSLEVLSPATS